MWTVSFVNPNFQQGPREYNSFYLPYSAGVIWQYALQDAYVKQNFQLGEFVWRREPLDVVAQRLCDHAVIGFSTYVWNKNYNYQLAHKIKQINPDCLIVFGGPEPPIEQPDFFHQFPFMDVMVKLEGEYSFQDILRAYAKREFEHIPGLLLNQSGEKINTGESRRVTDLDDVPSPYLGGTFDSLIIQNPEVQWNAVVETNRGCPYQCTFCDWGSLTYNKIKKFGLERVLDELEWCGRNRISFISIADANFGIFPERDNIIADKFVEVREVYGYPNNYTVNWAKNQRPEVVEIVKKMVNAGARSGLVVSVQSLNDDVLGLIKRRNMGINQIEEIFRICDRENICVITELILGLPGETLDSWRENYWRLLRADNHTGITYYNAQLLENSEMNLKQKQFHRIDSVFVKDYMSGTHQFDEVVEGMEVVRSTREMPYEHMLEALTFSWFMNTFHTRGISSWISRFAYHAAGLDYSKFYHKLWQWIQDIPWWQQQIQDIRYYTNQWLTQGSVDHPLMDSIPVYGINLGERTGIMMVLEDRHGEVFDHMHRFCLDLLPEHARYMPDLFAVAKSYLVRYGDLDQYPRTIKLDHDIIGFIQQGMDLDQPAEYRFEFGENPAMSRTTFCENIWYGRRRNFGKAIIHRLDQ